MAKMAVTGVKTRLVAEVEITLADAPVVQHGTSTFAPNKVTAVFGRTHETAWKLGVLHVEGERLVDGVRQPTQRRKQSYVPADDAPRWMKSLAMSYVPPRS